MGAVLRVTGPYHELNAALDIISLSFSEAIASTKARERNDSSFDGKSTFNLTVSNIEDDFVPQQVEECERFFAEHETELVMLKGLACAEEACLDFSWSFPKSTIAQFNRLPCSFLKRCVELGIDVEISVYACSDADQSF